MDTVNSNLRLPCMCSLLTISVARDAHELIQQGPLSVHHGVCAKATGSLLRVSYFPEVDGEDIIGDEA